MTCLLKLPWQSQTYALKENGTDDGLANQLSAAATALVKQILRNVDSDCSRKIEDANNQIQELKVGMDKQEEALERQDMEFEKQAKQWEMQRDKHTEQKN